MARSILLPVLLLCTWFSNLSLAGRHVRRETLRLSWRKGAPNGQTREMIFVNGQFPGPSLIFDEDDDVEVCDDALHFTLFLIYFTRSCMSRRQQITVYNDMPRNTTIHWHGIQ